jgi:Ca2+-binding RTX toxin-like protein
MPTSNIEVRRYTGPLLAPDLLAGQTTLLLSTFTAPVVGTLADNEGTLGSPDDGRSRFDGDAVTYVGSGTVRAGIDVGSLVVPTGPAVDVVAFSAGGETLFHFPDGEPGALSIIAMIIEIDGDPYEIFPNPYLGTPGADSFAGDGFNNIMTGEAGNDSITGGGGNDSIDGGGNNDTLRGGDGNDSIAGGEGNDSLFGDNGRDTLDGGGGDDSLNGGSGGDNLAGGGGNDSLFGGIGVDVLNGGDGDDSLNGDEGNDFLNGGGGSDSLSGSGGEDKLSGDSGADLLTGGNGDDELRGGFGNDTLAGQFDDDILFGNDGDDVLVGGSGTDLLFGGAGTDLLTGGTGADRFIFNAGHDVITDFNNADEIWLENFLPLGTSGADIVADFGAVVAGDAVFDFGGGRVLTVENVTSLASLIDDFAVI